MRKFLLVFLFQLVVVFTQAQNISKNNYQISGIVKSDGGTPVASYGISLKGADKDSIYAFTTTDENGKFRLSNLHEGKYFLVGDTSKLKSRLYKKVSLTKDSLDINIGTIVLSANPILLSEVKISGYKNFLERKIDRLVINIENSPLANGNTTMDIMKKLPSVVVQGGLIYVNGSSSVAILVDGKPASTNQTDLAQILKSLPSSSIEKIEIVTNPPSAFDAQNDNIINIVLKKDRMTSNITVTHDQKIFPRGQKFLPYEGGESISANVYASVKKLRISAVISNTYNYDKPGYLTDYSVDQTPSFIRRSYTTPNTASDFLSTKVNLGYDFSNRDILDLQISLFAIPYSSSLNSQKNTFLNYATSTDSSFNLFSKFRSHSYQPSGYISFTHYLNAKRTDFISGTATYGFSHYYPVITFLNEDKVPTLSQNEQYSTNVKSLKFDYKRARKLTTSLGVKFTESNNDQMIFHSGVIPDNFKFNEKVLAEYINLSGQSGSLSYQAGVRDEYTRSEGRTLSANLTPVIDSYNDLYPSFTFQYKLINKSSLNFSVTRRITRPNYENFNPYTLLTTDPFLTRSGDPGIHPLFTYKYEVSYTWQNFTFSVNYQDKQNVRVVALDNVLGDTIHTQAVNINEKNFVGAVSWSKDLRPWWSIIANAYVYDYNLYLLNDITKRSASFNVYLNQDFKLSSISKLEVSFQYISNSVIDYLQYTGHCNLGSAFSTSLGRDFDLSVGMDDILGTNKTSFINNYISVVSTSKPLVNDRTLKVGLTYKFKTSRKFNARSKRPDDFGEIRY
jgi:hypothetical protein